MSSVTFWKPLKELNTRDACKMQGRYIGTDIGFHRRCRHVDENFIKFLPSDKRLGQWL